MSQTCKNERFLDALVQSFLKIQFVKAKLITNFVNKFAKTTKFEEIAPKRHKMFYFGYLSHFKKHEVNFTNVKK